MTPLRTGATTDRILNRCCSGIRPIFGEYHGSISISSATSSATMINSSVIVVVSPL